MPLDGYTKFGPVFARFAVGAVMMVHGVGKLLSVGPAATEIAALAESIGSLGFPTPVAFAWLVAAIEAIGGLCLLIGLFTRLAAALVAGNMLVATLLVHLPNGFLVSNGGYEFTLVLFLVSVSLVVTGPGSLALDRTDVLESRGVPGSSGA